MIEVSPLILLVLVEAVIGLLILSGALLFITLRRKGRIRQAAHHLAQRVQSDEPARTDRLKTLLNEKFGYDGAELEQVVHDITQAEMRLFQNLINGYIKDDQVHLQQVDVDEENLVLAYQGLKTTAATVASSADAEGDKGDEMAQLQEENQRLSDELRVTMDTMGRMLNEYSSMFAGGGDKPLTRAKAAQPEEPEEEGAGVEAESLAEESENEIESAVAEEAQVQLPDTLTDLPEALYDGGSEQSSVLDEEVSEIIDEVMEIADEMERDEVEDIPAEQQQEDIGESLLDELEQVDIEVPELTPAELREEAGIEDLAEPDLATESEPEPALEAEPEANPESVPVAESEAASEDQPKAEAGSLEEEWAKLLEEDAESKQNASDK